MTRLSALLQQLDQAWQQLGMPVDQILAPGLPEDEILAALAPITDRPSREGIDWFAWHNGQLDFSEEYVHPIAFDLLPITDSIQVREQRLTQAQDLAAHPTAIALGEDADYLWRPGWLPIGYNGGGTSLAIDITTNPDTSQVRNINWADGERRLPVADTLADVIEFCLTALASGLYQWSDAEPRGWIYDYHATPIEWRRSGLL